MSFTKEQIDQYTKERGGYGGRHSPRPSVKIAKVICLLKQRKGATSFVNFVGR